MMIAIQVRVRRPSPTERNGKDKQEDGDDQRSRVIGECSVGLWHRTVADRMQKREEYGADEKRAEYQPQGEAGCALRTAESGYSPG